MSQKKEAAAVRVEKLMRGKRIVERRGKCMTTFQLSVGMLEIRLEESSEYPRRLKMPILNVRTLEAKASIYAI
jgi:hypothetical protein